MFRHSKVILLSERLKEDVVKYVKDEQIYYCPNGLVAIEEFDLTKKKDHSSIPNILFIGNLAESKGVYDLIDALSIIHKLNILFECTIIGSEGSINTEELNEKIGKAGLELKINYLGRVVGKEKELLLKKADMLVHPSHEECFPLVILEAMNFKLPVISTYEGGIPDIVVDKVTGFLVKKRDVNELSERIIELLSEPQLREEFGNKGRERFLEFFTIDQFEETFIEILKDILNEDRHS